MFMKTHVKAYQRGLWFRKGDFVRLLGPGTWFNFGALWNLGADKVEKVDTLRTRFEHPLLDVLLGSPSIQRELTIVDLADGQRAIVWKDGRVLGIFGPGRYAFWNTPAKIDVEIFEISEFRLTHAKLQSILATPNATTWLDGVMVNDHEDVLLYRDGVLIDRLRAGLHVFWKGTGKIAWKAIDRREQVADVAGQEIMTSDKVTLRVNLVVGYVVEDALKAVTSTTDHAQALYREAQLVLRAAIGTKTLDNLLGDKEAVGAEVRDALAKRAAEIGLRVNSVGLRDIILPGDMKLLLNQVIAATKEAEANLIKRREETAAARSQANTAKLLAENPQLQRLKELELLKEVLAGSKATFVFGQGDLIEQVKTLTNTSGVDAESAGDPSG
jgi:regulator of protease activity HflC (stomatin/prohibitin superfamily)